MKNNIYIILIFSLTLFSCEVFQPTTSPNPENVYIKMFGGRTTQEGIALQQLNDHSIYVLGHGATPQGNINTTKLYLLNLDEKGNEVWAKQYINGGIHEAVQMLLTLDKTNLLLLANEELSNNKEKIRISKVDLDGEEVWSSVLNANDNFSYEAANISTIDNSTNFLIVGTRTAVDDISQIYVTELDESGVSLWEKSYSFTDRKSEIGIDIRAYGTNNILVLGSSESLDSLKRPIIIEGQRTGVGEELQSKILLKEDTNISSIEAVDFLSTSTGQFTVLCDINDQTHLLKVDIETEQSILLDNTVTNPLKITEELEPISFTETSDNSLLITGKAGKQVGLIKTTSEGQPMWSVKKFGLIGLTRPEEYSVGSQVIEYSNLTNSLMIVGTLQYSGTRMIGVIKTNEQGELID